jgi:glycosyltransferase involved in cell wall biosynthesis
VSRIAESPAPRASRSLAVSVVIPTHNPNPIRLGRTFAGLRAQTLPAGDWELLIIDNASSPAVDLASYLPVAPPGARVVREPQLGLTAARRCGISMAQGEIIVLVDDDNVLAPDYLAHAARLFAAQPQLGAAGGKSIAEFESKPPAWVMEFTDLLACRDLGEVALISSALRNPATSLNEYPRCAPVGAGMILRASAARAWLADAAATLLPDRRGSELTSSGDNDIVLTLLHAGWAVGYFPELSLTHLIPAGRFSPKYLARLNRGIQKSWMQVLTKHNANPWPPIPRATVPLRQIKAWFTHGAWSGPAARVRWQGACGHFEGRSPAQG